MKPLHLLLLLPLLAGCAHNTGVVQLSADTYLISKSSAAGAFAKVPAMKAEVVQQAHEFAARQGKAIEPVSLHDTFPTHGFPSVDYQFRLVDKTNAPATPARP